MELGIDTLKLREKMMVPDMPSPVELMIQQTMDGLKKKEWEVIDDILHHHIDNPIDGELTKEKVKAAGIRGVMYSDEFPQSKIEEDGNDIRFSVTSGLMGVVQGDWLIGQGGARRPLTDKERDFYERLERMERMTKAERLAVEVFPVREKTNDKGTGTYDQNLPRRRAYQQGYEKAVSDALEWIGPNAKKYWWYDPIEDNEGFNGEGLIADFKKYMED